MNTKGFTLVELLAVIVILSLLALLTSTAVTKLVSDAKTDLSETQVALIKSAAQTWMADNLNKLPNEESCSYLTLEDLKNYGILDSNVLDPKTSQNISDDLKIKITTTLSKYGSPVNTVEVNPSSVDGCNDLYGDICTAVTVATSGSYTAGDIYSCKVDPNKDAYTFYVLNTSDDKVNLIMDSNIRIDGTTIKEANPTDKGLVAWVSSADYIADSGTTEDYGSNGNNNKGPLTALEYLSQATANWTNLDEQTISSFTDNTGVPHTMTKIKLYARLPHYSEVSSKTTSTAHLYNYLNSTVSGVNGYWLVSSSSSNVTNAWHVDYNGSITSGYVNVGNNYGVRPVITVLKDRMS